MDRDLAQQTLTAFIEEYAIDPEGEIPYPAGHENAIVGLSTDDRLVLDIDIVLGNLEGMDMTPEEAIDFFHYNTERAGQYYESPPIYLRRINYENITTPTVCPDCECQKGGQSKKGSSQKDG